MYKYARGIYSPDRRVEFKAVDNLYYEIKQMSTEYVAIKRGRGPTHVDAYREGARKVIEMILDGKYIIVPTQLELFAQ